MSPTTRHLHLEPVESEQRLLERIAERLRAMGNPTRLRILHALENGELSVGEIVTRVGSNQTNVSKHLAVLRGADLVARRRDGSAVYYRIGDEAVLALCRSFCDSLLDSASAELVTLEQGRAQLVDSPVSLRA